MSSEPNERWQKQRWGREQISLRPDWNFKNSAHNFNRVPIFEPGEWQLLSHQNQQVSRSCFMTPGMLAYPLAYIIPPAALWGGGGGSTATGEEEGGDGALEDKWLSFHWQAPSLPPSGWLFHELRFDSRSGPQGVWEAASSDSSLSPMCACWLTERPQRHPRSPNCSPPTRLQLTRKKHRAGTERNSKVNSAGWC